MGWRPLADIRDKAAFTLLVVGGPLDLAYERYIVSAHYEQTDIPVSPCYYAFLFFCAAHIYCNLYYVTTTDNRVLGSQAVKDVQFVVQERCERCDLVKLAQSHHCKICDVCILRRDHHCWFAGNCIGLYNQGNFLLLVFYMWLVAVVETVYNMDFVCSVLGCNISSLISICLPQMPLLIKEYSLYCITVNFMTFLGLLLLVLFSILFYNQCCQMISGLTKYERTKGRTRITPVMCNIKAVLGSNWYLMWLIPSRIHKCRPHVSGAHSD